MSSADTAVPDEAPSPTPRPRVLVVDCDDDMRTGIAAAIAATGTVVEARTTKDALGVLSQPGERFDVVIVACVDSRPVPEYADAVEFVHELFRRWPSLSVIALASSDHAERVTGDVLLSGVRDVVRAPVATSHLASSLDRVLSQHPVRRRTTAGNVAAIQRILKFLDDHVADIPALTELAVMAAMSRSHFSRTFHAVVGMPLRDYIRDLRLKRAHGLLLTARLSLTNIAVESGFYDLPHFDKTFRHRLGLSPHQFRARYASTSLTG